MLSFLPNINIEKWTITQIILSGTAVGLLSGLIFCYTVASLLPPDIEDLELNER